jgi:ADP-ribose pyrophosphatase
MAERIVFRGRKIQVAVDPVVLPEGKQLQREVILHPGAVAILPLLDADRLCLIRNQRHAVGETLLEIPAGTLNPGEAPEDTAIRELAEETGYQANTWKKLTEFYPSPGILSERMHLFLAWDLLPGPPHPEAGEGVEPLVMPWREALDNALAGKIQDAKTLIGLFWLDHLVRSKRLEMPSS